MYIMSIGIKPC